LEYDFYPLDPRSLRLFLVIDDTMEVWEYKFKPVWCTYRRKPSEALRRSDMWHGEWTKQAESRAPFRSPFHVTEIPNGVGLVTDSGKCYAASKDADGKWTCLAVWNEESRPLIAMIDVPDQKESYAFGKDFYFLLSAKPEPVKCRDVTLSRIEYGEPLRTSWECAKVLYEDGKIGVRQ
jgi:hypothetical protein